MSRRQTFVVARDDLRTSRIIDEPLPTLAPGEVLLRVDRFAFTANNLTYAELGERMAYWQFFAAPEGWGCIPAWGFADVLESRHAGLAPGERVYGFLPMATHVRLRPDRVTDAGFVDASEHRTALPGAYNLYLRTAGDASHRPELEDLQALLRPVFITAFLLDDLFADEAFSGVRRVVLSSASSKTAFGLAHQLHRRGGVEVVGLTSPANRAFVRGLACHDRVLDYDEIAGLPDDVPTIYVDFAGNHAVTRAVHERLGDRLAFSSAVGFTHRDAGAAAQDLPGVKPAFFFAPERLRKRARDWGREGLDARVAQAWAAFAPAARAAITVVRGAGPAAVEAVHAAALRGGLAPDQGHVLSLSTLD